MSSGIVFQSEAVNVFYLFFFQNLSPVEENNIYDYRDTESGET